MDKDLHRYSMAILLIVVLLSALFSTDRYTSSWSLGLLLTYIAVFYLTIHSINNAQSAAASSASHHIRGRFSIDIRL